MDIYFYSDGCNIKPNFQIMRSGNPIAFLVSSHLLFKPVCKIQPIRRMQT